jgi:hypothetical protein
MDRLTGVQLKAAVLSMGVDLSGSFLQNYDSKFLEKRRAYGNQDPSEYLNMRIPQEFYILPEKLICAINLRKDTIWKIDYINSKYVLKNTETDDIYEITFPLRPSFYDIQLTNGKLVSQYVTLYGGNSLGVFVYGDCTFSANGNQCRYCSLTVNKNRNSQFEKLITVEQISEVIHLVLADPSSSGLKQIMVNGGNMGTPDVNFSYYSEIVLNIASILKEKNRNESLELHLIVYPPNNLNLFEKFIGIDVSVSLNTEIYDFELFKKFCPGKQLTTTREHHYKSLEECIKVLGKGRVYSVFVGGIESIESLSVGIETTIQIGAIPVINILHTDPNTEMYSFPNPTPEMILEMGSMLQQFYADCDFIKTPFYENCGRNSIDYEAFNKMFS